MSALDIAIPVKPGANVRNYLDALSRLGARGVPVHAACDPGDYGGLLLPGGWDADPALYGQANTGSLHVDRALDDLQLHAMDAFVKAGRPVLGICRGHQMINVYFGGTLIQHLPESPAHSRDEGDAGDKVHPTRAKEGSFLYDLYGARFYTNSAHHQAVDRPGEGLQVVQWSGDGVVEGIVHRALPVWGVQWHPERMCFAHARADTVDGAKVIDMFLNECRGRDGSWRDCPGTR